MGRKPASVRGTNLHRPTHPRSGGQDRHREGKNLANVPEQPTAGIRKPRPLEPGPRTRSNSDNEEDTRHDTEIEGHGEHGESGSTPRGRSHDECRISG